MRPEYQVKIEGTLNADLLIEAGAEFLGSVAQKDVYLCFDETYRIRHEGEQCIYTEKGRDNGGRISFKNVTDRIITKEEAFSMEKRGIKAIVCKMRDLYKINDVVIALDEVEQVGKFVEIRSNNESSIQVVIQALGLSQDDIIKSSYLDMIVRKSLPTHVQIALRFHDKVGELAFGITSGIMTTTGVLVGMNSATYSRLSVAASIACVAMADSMSDSFGMYMSKISERGNTRGVALRYALGTLAGKFLFPVTCIAPIVMLPLSLGVWVDLAWGAVVLAFLSAENAIVYQRSVLGTVMKNLALATIIIIAAEKTGRFMNIYMK